MKSFIMKLNCLYIAGALAFALNFTGCTNLDEKVYSSYTDENFPSSPEQYASMTGPIYVAAQKLYTNCRRWEQTKSLSLPVAATGMTADVM